MNHSMKILFTLLLSVFSLFVASGQNVPNAGFENWHGYTFGEYPDSWSTSDSVSFANGGGTSVFKSTDAFDGTYCLHLKSTQITIIIFQVTGPGIATNGQVNLVGNNFVFSGGSPDTARSRFFTGWYKYNPLNPADAAIVKVYLFNNNGVTPRDTIAAGLWEHTGAVSTYDQFVIPMIYRDFVTPPDTCLIILQSSRGISDPTLGIGSEFVVDSLGFSGFVGVNELKNAISSVNVFPTPAKNEINIEVELKSNLILSYEIFDINGRLVQTSLMSSTKEKIDISNFSSGGYILKIGDARKNILYSTQFSIQK